MSDRTECPLVKVITESIKPKTKEQTCLLKEKRQIVEVYFPLDLLRVTDLEAPGDLVSGVTGVGTLAALQVWVQQGTALRGLAAAEVPVYHPAA